MTLDRTSGSRPYDNRTGGNLQTGSLERPFPTGQSRIRHHSRSAFSGFLLSLAIGVLAIIIIGIPPAGTRRGIPMTIGVDNHTER